MNNMWRSPSYYQPSAWSDGAFWEQAVDYRWPENLAYREAMWPRLWMPKEDEEWENEQDIEYFMELYPYQVKAMQRYVEGICDHFDYDGSPIYDEIPDRITLLRLKDMVLKNAGEDETLFGKTGYFGDSDCKAANDMAEILLYHEIVRRRRQKRGML